MQVLNNFKFKRKFSLIMWNKFDLNSSNIYHVWFKETNIL